MDKKNIKVNIEELLKKLGKKIRRSFKNDTINFYEKEPGEIVSTMDININKNIINFLKKNFPKDGIISEEFPRIKSKTQYNWYIDPIDGSRNYINKIPFFSISLALKKSKDTIAGFVYDPIHNDFYYAFKNKGAYINKKKIRNKNLPLNGLMLTETPKKKDKTNIKQNKIARKNFRVRQLGSSVLDMVFVASGKADIFWQENLKQWDYESGLLIAKEANKEILKKKIKQNNLIIIYNKNLEKKLISKFLDSFN